MMAPDCYCPPLYERTAIFISVGIVVVVVDVDVVVAAFIIPRGKEVRNVESGIGAHVLMRVITKSYRTPAH